jgi:hypothetical protein
MRARGFNSVIGRKFERADWEYAVFDCRRIRFVSVMINGEELWMKLSRARRKGKRRATKIYRNSERRAIVSRAMVSRAM